jgi:hypothetical protein
MKYFVVAGAPLLLLLLPACGGGGGSSASGQLPLSAPLGPLSQAHSLTEAQSDALQQLQPLYTPATNDLLYVGIVGNNSITVYKHNAEGNTAPLKVIAGPRTGISNPGQVSEDAQGNLYVANGAFTYGSGPLVSANPSILVFAHGANGNAAPIRKLAGPLTGIHDIEAMTVDVNTGKIFVFEDDGIPEAPEAPSLLRFPPNATGNTAPFARGSVNFPAIQLASDSTGSNLIEAHFGNSPSGVGFGIETLVKQFPNNSAPTVLYNTAWFGVTGMADDPTTKTYLTSAGSGIDRFAEKTEGKAGVRVDYTLAHRSCRQ